MIVLRYELGCGQQLELLIPTGQVRADQVLGDITARCLSCKAAQLVVRVQLAAVR